jgi:hypothetical protein
VNKCINWSCTIAALVVAIAREGGQDERLAADLYPGNDPAGWPAVLMYGEDADYRVLLDEPLVRDYSTLGYAVVRVPVLSPQERATFLLERLSEQGLI